MSSNRRNNDGRDYGGNSSSSRRQQLGDANVNQDFGLPNDFSDAVDFRGFHRPRFNIAASQGGVYTTWGNAVDTIRDIRHRQGYRDCNYVLIQPVDELQPMSVVANRLMAPRPMPDLPPLRMPPGTTARSIIEAAEERAKMRRAARAARAAAAAAAVTTDGSNGRGDDSRGPRDDRDEGQPARDHSTSNVAAPNAANDEEVNELVEFNRGTGDFAAPNAAADEEVDEEADFSLDW